MSIGRNRARSSLTSGLTCSRALRHLLCARYSRVRCSAATIDGGNPDCELIEMASAMEYHWPGRRKKAKAFFSFLANGGCGSKKIDKVVGRRTRMPSAAHVQARRDPGQRHGGLGAQLPG